MGGPHRGSRGPPKGLGVPPEGQRGVWRPYRRVGRPSWIAGRGRAILSEEEEGSGGPHRWPGDSEVPPREPGGIGRPSWRANWGRKTLPEDLQGSGDPFGALAQVRMHSQRARSGREAYLEGREGTQHPTGRTGGSGGFWIPFRRAGRGLEALTESWEVDSYIDANPTLNPTLTSTVTLTATMVPTTTTPTPTQNPILTRL